MSRLPWLADVLRADGLFVIETLGWKSRGKDGIDPETKVDSSMRPRIVIVHHTATHPDTRDPVVTNLLINGRPAGGPNPLPGPLCHLGLNRAGQFLAIASGKANHAGPGRWEDANESVEAIGIEAYNWGAGVPFPSREPWPQVQLEAYERGVAALLRHIKRDQRYVCAHREWATPAGRKPDPSGINMQAFRLKVGYLLASGDQTVIVRAGENGNYVRPFQEALNNWAVKQAVAGWVPLVADGNFGPATKSGVEFYQRAAQVERRVPEVGALDDLTRDLLERFIES